MKTTAKNPAGKRKYNYKPEGGPARKGGKPRTNKERYGCTNIYAPVRLFPVLKEMCAAYIAANPFESLGEVEQKALTAKLEAKIAADAAKKEAKNV